jgi:hypothetical protein
MVGICRRNCEAEVRMQSKAEVAKATELLSAVTIYVFFLSVFSNGHGHVSSVITMVLDQVKKVNRILMGKIYSD